VFRLAALRGTKTLSVDGVDYALSDYYPAILSPEAFDELQSQIRQSGRRKGKGELPGIITGLRLTQCGYCGSAMVAQNLMNRKKEDDGRLHDTYRRLSCGSGQAYRRCPVGGSTSIAPIERALLDFCSDQINLDALLERGAVDPPARQKLAAAKARVADVDAQLRRLTDALMQDDGAAPAIILRKVRELEDEGDRLRREVADADAEWAAVSRKAPTTAHAWRELVIGVKSQDYDARLKARQLVADTFARIVVYRVGVEPGELTDPTLDLVLVPHGGHPRALRIHRKTGQWLGAEDTNLRALSP